MLFRYMALGLLLFSVGCRSETPTIAPLSTAQAVTGTVTVEVKLGEELRTFEVPDVADGATLESVMESIDQIPINMTGSGTTAFVNAIGDTKTNSTEGWTFMVDGQWADTGIGSTVLHPPTTVTWVFGEWGTDSTQ